jgi:hypothetical protein
LAALQQVTNQYLPWYVDKSYEVSPTREQCGSRKNVQKEYSFMTRSLSLQAHKRLSLFRNRQFGLLWLGQTLSITGDFFFSATIAIWIIDKLARGASWLPLAMGAVAMSMVLPSLVVSPLAGVWVDR